MMTKRILVLAGAFLVSVSLAAPARAAKCELLPEQARDQYLKLREAMNKANEAASGSAIAIKQYGPTFKKAVEEYHAANKAIHDHAAKKPGKDIEVNWGRDQRSLENQAQVKEWEAAELRLRSTREQKMATLNQAFATLGNWRYWTSHLGKQQMEDTENDIAECLSVLEADGNAAAAEYKRLISSVRNPNGADDYALTNYKNVPTDTGMLEAADGTNEAAKKARKEVVSFSNKCPYGVVLADDGATTGREVDGNNVDQNRRNNPASTTTANGNNANSSSNANTSEQYDDFGNLIEERNTNNPNSNAASNANVATASNANASNANAAGNSNAGNANAPATVYTVKAGDNLTAIARSLAPTLGNPPISELVSVLYANMTTKSKTNPNLIFPGDTINLANVKKDLAG